jgi:DNA-binding NarL/FixJ family response regulator
MSSSNKTLVLLVGMHGILGEIVREIVSHQPDLEIAGEVGDSCELRSLIEPASANVVIACLADEPSLGDTYPELLDHHSRLKLLAVHGDGRHASLFRLRPERLPIGDLSPDVLVEAIRDVANLTQRSA